RARLLAAQINTPVVFRAVRGQSRQVFVKQFNLFRSWRACERSHQTREFPLPVPVKIENGQTYRLLRRNAVTGSQEPRGKKQNAEEDRGSRIEDRGSKIEN